MTADPQPQEEDAPLLRQLKAYRGAIAEFEESLRVAGLEGYFLRTFREVYESYLLTEFFSTWSREVMVERVVEGYHAIVRRLMELGYPRETALTIAVSLMTGAPLPSSIEEEDTEGEEG